MMKSETLKLGKKIAPVPKFSTTHHTKKRDRRARERVIKREREAKG